MKIIDSHVHLVQCIAGTEANGEMRSCGQGRGICADGTVYELIPAEWHTDTVTPERVLQDGSFAQQRRAARNFRHPYAGALPCRSAEGV